MNSLGQLSPSAIVDTTCAVMGTIPARGVQRNHKERGGTALFPPLLLRSGGQ